MDFITKYVTYIEGAILTTNILNMMLTFVEKKESLGFHTVRGNHTKNNSGYIYTISVRFYNTSVDRP